MTTKTPKDIEHEAIKRYEEAVQERLIAGRYTRARRDGRGSGPLPYGYKIGPYDSIEIDQEHAKIVRLIFDLAANGYSQEKIAIHLNDHNLRTSKKALWTASAIQQILRHAMLYTTGIREWSNETPRQQWPILLNVTTIGKGPIQTSFPLPAKKTTRKSTAAGTAATPSPAATTVEQEDQENSSHFQPPMFIHINADDPPVTSSPASVTSSEHIYLPPGADDLTPQTPTAKKKRQSQKKKTE